MISFNSPNNSMKQKLLMNLIMWTQMGLREVRSLAPDCTAAQLEGPGFEPVSFDYRGCDFSRWILEVKLGESRCLGP